MHRFAFSCGLVMAASLPWTLAQSAPTPTVTPIAVAGAVATTAPGQPPAPTAKPGTPGLLPAQTPMELQLETHLSTRDNKYGDGFAARVDKAVYLNGQEMIPAGSILEGHIVRIQDARPLKGDSELLLRPDLLTTPDGQHYTISAEVIKGDPLNPAKLDNEGTLRQPRGMMQSDVQHTEIAGGAGMVAGAVLAGAKGAMVAGPLGAAAVVGIWLVRYRHLDLNPGSHLTVRLDQPLQLTAKAATPPVASN